MINCFIQLIEHKLHVHKNLKLVDCSRIFITVKKFPLRAGSREVIFQNTGPSSFAPVVPRIQGRLLCSGPSCKRSTK